MIHIICRLFNGDQVNERRSGGNIHFAYNHRFSDLLRMVQNLQLEFSSIRIETDENTATNTPVTSLESGHQLIRTSYLGFVPASFLVDGRFLVGKDHDDDVIYSKIRLGSRIHRTFSGTFDLSTSIFAEWATRNIPVFELPSFGGGAVCGVTAGTQHSGKPMLHFNRNFGRQYPVF
jgi:hypothetical protein